MRKLTSLVCYVVAGFFIYAMCLLAFASFGGSAAAYSKVILLGIFALPALVFLALGAMFSVSARKKWELGVVLLSALGVMLFAAFSIICLWLSPEVQQMMPHNPLNLFGDYVAGGVTLLALFAVGMWLVTGRTRGD